MNQKNGILEGGFKDEFPPSTMYSKDAVTHEYQLESAYEPKNGKKGQYTYIVQGKYKDTLDFIWYSSSSLKLLANMTIMDEKDEKEIRQSFLPNKHFPSDHLSIAAVFLLLDQKE